MPAGGGILQTVLLLYQRHNRRVKTTSPLTLGTIKRRPLRLHEPQNRSLTTATALLPRPVIDAMMVLITTFFTKGITVSSVRKRRTFVANCFFQNHLHRSVNLLPLARRDAIAASPRINTRDVEQF